MPAGDRTGPFGAGSRSGRGMGLCNGAATPGFMNNRFGSCMVSHRGMWLGRGYGRGYGLGLRRAGVDAIKSEEKQLLQNRVQAIEAELKAISVRISEIETDGKQP